MENTAEYILEKVAPVFNRQGYIGTSLTDLTNATQLTKGAIYCNFESKEDLAVQAFYHNVKKVIRPLQQLIEGAENPLNKLYAITNYYRNYYETAAEAGGCPVLNVGIDAQNNNPKLYEAAKKVGERLYLGLSQIIEEGMEKGELKPDLNASELAGNIYAMIEGSIFIAFTFGNKNHLLNILNHIDQLIETQMKL